MPLPGFTIIALIDKIKDTSGGVPELSDRKICASGLLICGTQITYS
jgi:hypothetical protein